jgi:hypothetical protein
MPDQLRTTLFAALVILVAGARLPAAAERAASVEYAFVERPSWVQADLAAPPSVTMRFLAITALDGSRVDAVLGEPKAQGPASATLIISVHGSGGRYDTGSPASLIRNMPAQGYPVLGINTRQSGERVATDNFFDIRRDIDAAVYTARALGYRAIVLHGQSLGNIQVLYYAANNWDPDLKGVVLTAMFGNLPWKSRHILTQDENGFAKLHKAALEALHEGKDGELLALPMRNTSGQAQPVTARHFLTYRVEESSTADGTYWVRRVPRPILMVRDDGDAIIEPFEPYMLLSAATSQGSLVPSIEYVRLPNEKGRNPGGHAFSDNETPLVETLVTWLREHIR